MNTGGIWKHKKSGGLYLIIGFCVKEDDFTNMVLYKEVPKEIDRPEILWARPVGEFFDGRFTQITNDK